MAECYGELKSVEEERRWYRKDLAYIHDVGFSDYVLQSIPGILEILDSRGMRLGLIIDLGCGSGLSTQKFIEANYHAVGIDISPSMLDIAIKRVPQAKFILSSLFEVKIPPCNAVVSIGECLNYLFDRNNNNQTLSGLFERVYQALLPKGVFIFDLLEPEEVDTGITQKFREGKDWVVLTEKQEDRQQQTLTRRIITFRKIGEYYRRDEEIHQVRLYKSAEIAAKLRQVGFDAQLKRNLGKFNLPPAHTAFVAYKN